MASLELLSGVGIHMLLHWEGRAFGKWGLRVLPGCLFWCLMGSS